MANFARFVTDYGQCTQGLRPGKRPAERHAVRAVHWSEEIRAKPRASERWGPFTNPFSGTAREQARRRRSCHTKYVFAASLVAGTARIDAAGLVGPRLTVARRLRYLFANNDDLARWQSWVRSIAGRSGSRRNYKVLAAVVLLSIARHSFAGRSHSRHAGHRFPHAMRAIGMMG